MRWTGPVLALAVVCGLGASPVRGEEPRGLPADFRDPAADARTTVLDNGLTVLTLEDPSTPVVSFQVWVKAGSVDESRHTGLAHLFEHMMFKGTRHLGPEQFTELVQSRGGRLNAYTSHDVTVYFENIPPSALPLVIDLEAERFAHLRIDAELLDTEREVVLEERRMRTEDSPRGLAFEALFGLAFQAHSYRHPVIGWRSDVEAVDVEAARDFYRTYYAPNNLVIAIAGAFDTEPVLERIERRWGGMEPAPAIPRNPTREPEQRGVRRATVHHPVQSPVLFFAWHAPPTGHEDGPALDALGEILSTGRSSRLYRRLVSDAQVALAANAGYWEMQEAGVVFGSISVRPDAEVDRAEALLLEELGRIRAEAPSEAEVATARRQLEVRLVNGLRTANALARRLGRDQVAFGRIRPLEELLEDIRAVTPADVQRVARTYLRPEARNIVRVVPPAEDASEGQDQGR